MDINNCHICDLCFSPCETESGICKNCHGYDEQNYPNALKPGTVLAGKYITGKVLGKGGFGITYLGYDTTKNEKVAIKEYMPVSFAYRTTTEKTVRSYSVDKKEQFDIGCKKFYEEAELVSKFNEFENIIHVHEFFFENNTAYFVMEYLEGTDLKEYIKLKGGKISEEEALEILTKMADILEEVHKQGIIHRDISPDNIFMCKNGTIKLIDFGASRQFCNNQSQSMSVILKPSFAPVEQYQRHGKQGPETDIYALGATIYYSLSGQMIPDALARIAEDTLDLSCVSPQMKILLSGMLALMPKKRYPGIQSLKNDLIAMKKHSLNLNTDIQITNYFSRDDVREFPDLFCRNCAQPLVNGKCPKCSIPPVNHNSKGLSGGLKAVIISSAALIFIFMIAASWMMCAPSSSPEPVPVSGESFEIVNSPTSYYVFDNSVYKRNEIKEIVFETSGQVSENGSDSWDISETGDNSVIAQISELPDGGLKLSICAKEKIKAPRNMSEYFKGYTALESICFGNCFDTSSTVHMDSMFEECTMLKSVDFSGIDTSNVTDISKMFSKCSGIEVLDLTGFDTSSVTTLSGLFNECVSLREVNLSSFDTSNVTNMNGLFSGCESLESIMYTTGSFTTSSVTDMSYMFFKCKSFTSLDLSSFDTSSVKDFSHMFSSCEFLTEINLSSFNTWNAQNMGSMFYGCKSMETIDLSTFNTENATDLSGMFWGCSGLKNINGMNLNTANNALFNKMFSNCISLEYLDLKSFDGSKATSVAMMFENCSSLRELDLSAFNPPEDVFAKDMFVGCSNLNVKTQSPVILNQMS